MTTLTLIFEFAQIGGAEIFTVAQVRRKLPPEAMRKAGGVVQIRDNGKKAGIKRQCVCELPERERQTSF